MTGLARIVRPEILDDLAPLDPRASRARRDLKRVHRAMGSIAILRRAVSGLMLTKPPQRILELGAGDGSLLLRLAQSIRPKWVGVELTLLDRVDLLSDADREAYRRLDWKVSVKCVDVMTWAREISTPHYDLCIANLFLHHFDAAELVVLLPAIAMHADAFVACEPRRDRFSLLASHLIGILGASAITRADAVTSVIAGFKGSELRDIWPRTSDIWILEEFAARPFTHCFHGVRSRAGMGRPHERY